MLNDEALGDYWDIQSGLQNSVDTRTNHWFSKLKIYMKSIYICISWKLLVSCKFTVSVLFKLYCCWAVTLQFCHILKSKLYYNVKLQTTHRIPYQYFNLLVIPCWYQNCLNYRSSTGSTHCSWSVKFGRDIRDSRGAFKALDYACIP